jgi:hypothetical protein
MNKILNRHKYSTVLELAKFTGRNKAGKIITILNTAIFFSLLLLLLVKISIVTIQSK